MRLRLLTVSESIDQSTSLLPDRRMNPVLFVFLYAFNLLESTESTLNVYCGTVHAFLYRQRNDRMTEVSHLSVSGSRYRLGNETVAIYHHFGKKLRLTVSERWNGHGRVPIWNVTSVTQKYAAKIEKFLSRNGTTQTLTIQMNNITNGAVVWYAYDGERFKSGEATVLIGGMVLSLTLTSLNSCKLCG